jgi:Flp pilus assembly protein TadG
LDFKEHRTVIRTSQNFRRGRESLCRRRFGGSVLEMVLTLSILLNLTFGGIEFGYYFYVKNTMEGAAREGVRAGIVPGAADSNITTAVNNVLSAAGQTTGNFTVSISPDLSTAPAVGTNLTITITANWGTVGSGFRPLAIISANKTLTSTAVMRIE